LGCSVFLTKILGRDIFLGVFNELSMGEITREELLLRKGLIKEFQLKFTQTESIDEIDRIKIQKLKNLLRLKAIYKLNALEQAQITFEDTENYMVVFNKLQTTGGWHDFIGIKSEIGKIKSYENKKDAYISTASYVSKKTAYDENGKKLPQRTQTNIKDIVILSQDCDFYKYELTEDDALQILAEKIHKNILEMPHFIIFSGKGLQLVWLTDTVMAKKGSGSEKLFKAIQSHLMKSLKELNPDNVVMTPSNVIRLANTINSKNDAIVRAYILRTDRKPLGYFKENYLPIPTPNKKVPRPRKKILQSNVVRDTRLWNTYTLNYQRAHDVFRIVKYKQEHNESLIGIRQHLALLLRFHTLVYTNGDYSAALQKVGELWDMLEERDHTSFEEIERRSRTAERYYKEWIGEVDWQGKGAYANPGLFYKNQTLIKHWSLSKRCQVELKTIKIRDKEYERLRKEIENRKKGIKSHAEKKNAKIEAIRAILEDNPKASAREIAKITGMTHPTVSKYMKAIKSE
jgi:Winged helix-turn-helix DNA-binding